MAFLIVVCIAVLVGIVATRWLSPGQEVVTGPAPKGWVEIAHLSLRTGWSTDLEPRHRALERVSANPQRPHRDGLVPPPRSETQLSEVDWLPDPDEEAAYSVAGPVPASVSSSSPIS